MDTCCATWQEAWTPGDIIVADETMVQWTGTGEVHVTFQARKPTPYGIELKSLACGSSNIMLVAEVAEGKEKDS